MKRQKNPLNRRILRIMKNDWRRYLAIFVILMLITGFVSAAFVGNESLLQSIAQNNEENNLEDGHIELKNNLTAQQLEEIETGKPADLQAAAREKAEEKVREVFDDEFFRAAGISDEEMKKTLRQSDAYDEALKEALEKAQEQADEQAQKAAEKLELDDSDYSGLEITTEPAFFAEAEEKSIEEDGKDSTIRIYTLPQTINLPDVLEGELPDAENEIAIDRMHADNAGLQTGDRVEIDGKEWIISGLTALPEYATLHKSSSDFMFDALTFDVGLVTEEGFERLDAPVHYAWSWKYENEPADDNEARKMGEALLKAVASHAAVQDNSIEGFQPAFSNPAIQFAPEDIASDAVMTGVILYMLVLIIAFICAVASSAMIEKESRIIGTLLASGYSRREVIFQYIWIPVIVSIAAALAGNLLGYTVLRDFVYSMYYNSYSLPVVQTVFSPNAFVKTTVIPALLMFGINWLLIWKALRHTPLEFLRNDFRGKKKNHALRLPEWKFVRRFQTRVIVQNIPGYLILLAGVFFTALLLSMAVGLPYSLAVYQDEASDLLIAPYQTVLVSDEDDDGKEIVPDEADAEKFDMISLVYVTPSLEESTTVYGISPSSSYVPDVETEGNELLISRSFLEKYGIKPGDELVLKEEYSSEEYTFTVSGVRDDTSMMSVFLSQDSFNKIFGESSDTAAGYFSNEELASISEDDKAMVITRQDITKMADQLDHSMGGFMGYFQVLCVLLAAVLIWLISRIILERNEKSIALIKILGYSRKEISRLYLNTTLFVLIAADALCCFAAPSAMNLIWKEMMQGYSGWFSFQFSWQCRLMIFVFILAGYLLTRLFSGRQIDRISMDKVLKQTEE